MTVFSGKISIFTQNFLMTFFSHRPGFSDFPCHYYVKCRIIARVYDPFLTRKTTVSEKNSFMTLLFLFCWYLRAYLTTLLLKILGAVPPPQILGGPSPSPP